MISHLLHLVGPVNCPGSIVVRKITLCVYITHDHNIPFQSTDWPRDEIAVIVLPECLSIRLSLHMLVMQYTTERLA